jgi:glycosyltransferase involved in cell wall biosynthesis
MSDSTHTEDRPDVSETSIRGVRAQFSVVVPVYRNEQTLGAVVDALAELAGALEGPLEVVFVVDGSPDGSALILRKLLAESTPFAAQLIVLSRNFGAFSAVRAGIAAAEGDYVAVMAADLQEPISVIAEFFHVLLGAECDVVVGLRSSRSDPRLAVIAARIFWSLFRRIVHRDIPPGGVDVFGCTRQVAAELIGLNESHSSLIGLLYWLGFRRVEVSYVRAARREGQSGWSVTRRLQYFLDSLFSFTDLPLAIITLAGVVGIGASVVVGVTVLIAWASGAITVAGYTPLMLVVVFMGSLILLALGVTSSYVWRTYENTKGRPSAVPMSIERFPGP